MISICTLSARKWDFEDFVRDLMNAAHSVSDLEWVLIDFLYEENYSFVRKLVDKYNIPIRHLPNVLDGPGVSFPYMRDIARNRNKALQYAKGDYVIFVDDFSRLGPNFISHHINLIYDGAISCGRLEKYPHTEEVFDNRYLLLNKPAGTCKVLGPEWTYTGNLAAPMSVFKKLGGFDPRLSSRGEDCDFGVRADAMGIPIAYNPNALLFMESTENKPYHLPFDHDHPLLALNDHSADVLSSPSQWCDRLSITVEDRYAGHKAAICTKCGAEYLLEPAKFIYEKLANKELIVPFTLSGIR